MALIPAERLVDWTPQTKTGVVGGVWQYLPGGASERVTADMIDVTQAPYSADNTGATDASAAIQSAVNAVGSADGVYVPPGTYRLNNGVTLGSVFNGKTFRGAGPTTIFDQRASAAIIVGSNQGISPPDYDPVSITAGIAKDSNTLTLYGVGSLWQGDLTVGKIIQIQFENDYTLPVFSVYGYNIETQQATMNQLTRITSKNVINSTTMEITIDPPLLENYGSGALDSRVLRCVFQASDIGIEDFKVTSENSVGQNFCVQILNCYNSWMYGVETEHYGNYPVNLNCSLRCEIRRSIISGPSGSGTNGAGILFFACHSLVEDNIIKNTFPIMEMNGGSAGNAWLYNYSPEGMWLTTHGPHNQYNLIEGNAIDYQKSDGYFGSDAYLTMFRNYFHGVGGVNLKRFNRKTSLVGNLMLYSTLDVPNVGNPNITSGESVGTASLINDDPWEMWGATGTLIERTSDTVGVIFLDDGKTIPYAPGNGAAGNITAASLHYNTTQSFSVYIAHEDVSGSTIGVSIYGAGSLPPEGTTFTFWGGPNGYQERDLDVYATFIGKGNYGRTDEVMSSLDGDPLIDSLAYSSIPDWWADEYPGLPWPPFDPENPEDTTDVERIPAGYRYVNGEDSGPTLTCTTLNVTTFTIG